MFGRRFSAVAVIALALLGGTLAAAPASAGGPLGPVWNDGSGGWHRPYRHDHHGWRHGPRTWGWYGARRCWTEVRTIRIHTRHHGWVWRDRLVRHCR